MVSWYRQYSILSVKYTKVQHQYSIPWYPQYKQYQGVNNIQSCCVAVQRFNTDTLSLYLDTLNTSRTELSTILSTCRVKLQRFNTNTLYLDTLNTSNIEVSTILYTLIPSILAILRYRYTQYLDTFDTSGIDNTQYLLR